MPAVAAAAIVGLFGTAVISPAQPVCRAGEPCTRPAAGMTLVFTNQRNVAKSVVTTTKGTYRIRLAPGTYTVRVAGNRIARVDPLKVVVRRGLLVRRDFAIDVGIR
ncbi:MAG TPA: carboxypeptidase regulatory-like domain-containing protein [Gaiellaceae bacterium]|nr:carboxypeptidase regulatory-like domain-containing protein [Gaiellaceae bacterium]